MTYSYDKSVYTDCHSRLVELFLNFALEFCLLQDGCWIFLNALPVVSQLGGLLEQ